MSKFFVISLISLLICVSTFCETILASSAADNQLKPQMQTSENTIESLARPVSSFDPLTGMEFVLIKGGCFQMGSPTTEKGRAKDEGLKHEVCLDDFWMGRYEVTNLQYRFLNADHDSRGYFNNDLNDDRQPAVYISWQDATGYAAWLSEKSKKTYRLPTEAEWEYAARGMTTTVNYWGDDQDQTCAYANVCDQSARQSNIGLKFHNCTDGYVTSAPVGTFKPNAFGLYDMLGNVWEWTGDWYTETPATGIKSKNPKGPKSGKFRVLRGGSWFSDPQYVRAAQRSWYRPDSHNNSLGFRLVMPATH